MLELVLETMENWLYHSSNLYLKPLAGFDPVVFSLKLDSTHVIASLPLALSKSSISYNGEIIRNYLFFPFDYLLGQPLIEWLGTPESVALLLNTLGTLDYLPRIVCETTSFNYDLEGKFHKYNDGYGLAYISSPALFFTKHKSLRKRWNRLSNQFTYSKIEVGEFKANLDLRVEVEKLITSWYLRDTVKQHNLDSNIQLTNIWITIQNFIESGIYELFLIREYFTSTLVGLDIITKTPDGGNESVLSPYLEQYRKTEVGWFITLKGIETFPKMFYIGDNKAEYKKRIQTGYKDLYELWPTDEFVNEIRDLSPNPISITFTEEDLKNWRI